jgi:TctA family transporter
VPIFAGLMRLPFALLAPLILTICLTGAWMVSGSGFDVALALGFGLLGYAMKKLDYPIAPLVLAMVLGDKAEDAFRQSMLLSQGSLSIFWSNALVASLTGLALFFLALPLLQRAFSWRRA